MIEVELRNISKTIHKTPILHDINLKFHSGAIYGLKGKMDVENHAYANYLRIDDTKHRNGQYQWKSTHEGYRASGKHWGVD